MACSIAAQKCGVQVAHVEAGIRSGDRTMPEEINRIVTDAITDYFFTTSEFANANLRAAGVAEARIFFVGNTMIDTLLANMDRLRAPALWNAFALEKQEYFVLTLHRPANVDTLRGLAAALRAIGHGCRGRLVVFPVHPRTARNLRELDDLPPNIRPCEAQPYLEFNYLVKHAKAVITDSGGITEETTVMGVPCLTLRDSTERPETVTIGTNELVGTDPARLQPVLDRLFAGEWKKGGVPEKWDGRTSERIVEILERILTQSAS
jgi:UDP-N-acetylglucosamine 2-epimerase (non-hydrolysing)